MNDVKSKMAQYKPWQDYFHRFGKRDKEGDVPNLIGFGK